MCLTRHSARSLAELTASVSPSPRPWLWRTVRRQRLSKVFFWKFYICGCKKSGDFSSQPTSSVAKQLSVEIQDFLLETALLPRLYCFASHESIHI